MRTKRVLRAAVAFLFAFGVLAADLTPLRLPPQTASAVTQASTSTTRSCGCWRRPAPAWRTAPSAT